MRHWVVIEWEGRDQAPSLSQALLCIGMKGKDTNSERKLKAVTHDLEAVAVSHSQVSKSLFPLAC